MRKIFPTFDGKPMKVSTLNLCNVPVLRIIEINSMQLPYREDQYLFKVQAYYT
jgi:hypothetical protein